MAVKTLQDLKGSEYRGEINGYKFKKLQIC